MPIWPLWRLLLLTVAATMMMLVLVVAAAPPPSAGDVFGGHAGSLAVPELVGGVDRNPPPPPPPSAGGSQLRSAADPYDEFAEPRRLDWPRPPPAETSAARLRRRLLWRLARHPELGRKLERLGPALPAHSRDARLDRPDPYSEFASEAYYRFVKAILDMRNRMAGHFAGFDETSAIREYFEETPPSTNGTGGSTPAPPGPTVTPSPPVLVCPPRWRLGDRRCEANGTFCFKDAECPKSRCCFDGCKLRCLEPELLVRHVCKDYTNSTVFPGDLYMRQKTQICTCDELGRPVGCKDKKPCIDVISSSLFKLPFISNKTAKLRKRERTTRRKIYDALQEAFKNVKKVY